MTSLIIVVFLVGWTRAAFADPEVIADAENPDAPQAEGEDRPSSEGEGTDTGSGAPDPGGEMTADPDESGAETIFDPENSDGETILDPENRDADTAERPEDRSRVDTDDDGGDAFVEAGFASGRWQLVGAVDTAWDRPTEDVYELINTLSLRVDSPFGRNNRAVLAARLFHALLWEHDEDGNDTLPGPFDDAGNPRALTSLDLEEAWVSSRVGPVFVKLGLQPVVWGSSDLTRPSDVVGPLSLGSAGLYGTEALSALRSSPVLAARADLVGQLGAVSLVVLPFFSPHRVSLLATDDALLRPESPLAMEQPIVGLLAGALDPSLYDELEPALVGTSLPDQTPDNTSVGIRGRARLGTADVAVGYLYGWDRVPTLSIDPALADLLELVAADPATFLGGDLLTVATTYPEVIELSEQISDRVAAGETVLSATYRRWHVLVADATVYLGPIGIRADVAATPGRNLVGEDMATQRQPVVNSALGLSFEGDEGELAILLEGYWFHVFRDEGEPRALVFGDNFYGVVGAVTADLEHWTPAPVSLRVGGQLGARHLESLVSASASWNLRGDARLFFGGQWWNRPLRQTHRLTLGDLYATNDQVFVGFEHDF